MTTTPKHEISLDAFLAPITHALGRTQVEKPATDLDVDAMIPPHTTDGLSGKDLVDRFHTEAEAIRATVHECTKANVASEIAKIVQEADGGDVLCADDPRLKSLGIEAALKDVKNATVARYDAGKGREACLAQGAAAAFGITFADAAVAETASIMQVCGPKTGRSISLLPAVHIAVIDTSVIVPSMLDVLQKFDDRSKLPSQICFISGPSMTSDIELVRVDGVHGPTALHYVLLEG